jgi:hypothetical protein
LFAWLLRVVYHPHIPPIVETFDRDYSDPDILGSLGPPFPTIYSQGIEIITGCREKDNLWVGIIKFGLRDSPSRRYTDEDGEEHLLLLKSDYRPRGGIRLYIEDASGTRHIVDLNRRESLRWFGSGQDLLDVKDFNRFWNDVLCGKYLPQLQRR